MGNIHFCRDCGADISFYFSHEDDDSDAVLCPVCLIQDDCSGGCGITEDQARALNLRVIARLCQVLDMVHALEDATDMCAEISQIGSMPEAGLDVDISEHHVTQGIVHRLDTTSMELAGVIKALARTLPPVLARYPKEAQYALMHHPASVLVRGILAYDQ